MASRNIELFDSLSRAAAAYNSEDQTTAFAKGLIVYLSITDVGAAGTVNLKIQGKDTVTGEYIDLASASFAQQAATGVDMLTIYPGIAETANLSVSDRMPTVWRAVLTIGVNAVTASVFATAVD